MKTLSDHIKVIVTVIFVLGDSGGYASDENSGCQRQQH